MYREFILFGGIVVLALFMSIHNSNQETINQSETKFKEHKEVRDNLLMKEGSLLKIGNGVFRYGHIRVFFDALTGSRANADVCI